jgi:hypothetical protein
MDLDKKYGPLLDAVAPWGGNAVEEWERAFFPRSMSTLTNRSAGELKALMQSVCSSFRIDQFLLLDVIILWLVNQDGDVLFAIEEAVLDGAPLDVPRHRRAEHKIGKEKLGHPALVAGQKARVAGEIYYDPRGNAWIINMRSGRYSTSAGRSPKHLDNVREKFAEYAILLTPDH